MSVPDDPRRPLEAAAGILAEYRRLAGVPPPVAAPAWREASEERAWAALEDARARASRLERELSEMRRAWEDAASDRKDLVAAAMASAAAAAEETESLRARARRADERVRELERACARAQAETGQAQAEIGKLEAERARLEEECARLDERRLDAQRVAAATAARARDAEESRRAGAPAAAAPAPESAGPEDEAAAAREPVIPPEFVAPCVEPLLDPGWARFLRLARPPVEAAYAHLRRLSMTALTTGQKALLRMAAASIAQATDALASVELALEEGPAPVAPGPAQAVLESSLASWEAAFRRSGVALAREWAAPLPDAPHDAQALRVMLHHVLRNALEAVPRGGRLTVRAGRGPEGGLRIEFSDDGPGFPAEWLERRFEPFAAPRRGRAGLGLSLVRRTLRRWGGDAEASNGPSGRGARLVLTFAPPCAAERASR